MKSHNGSKNHGPDVIGRVTGGDVLPVLEPELAALGARLDELAAAEASSAPLDLNNQVFEASRAGIAGRATPVVVARIGPDTNRRSRVLTPLRAAAGVALAAAVALAIVAGHGRPRVPGGAGTQNAALESDVNEWLALSDGMVGDLAVQIDGLDADSAILREQLNGGTLPSNLFMDEGAF
jgi:hypothetical protein